MVLGELHPDCHVLTEYGITVQSDSTSTGLEVYM